MIASIKWWLRRRIYHSYLKSKWWQVKRLRILERDKWQCTRCESRHSLEVHHLTYERLYFELDSDLETLCRGCHVKEHSHGENKYN